MIKVIFIHGTGVRKKEYESTFKVIEQKIKSQRQDIEVIPCLWGDEYGAQLKAKGASVPRYDETLAVTEEFEFEDGEIILWAQLYRNPLYELQLLSLESKSDSLFSREDGPGDTLNEKVRALTAEGEYQPILIEAGITEIFTKAQEMVVSSDAYEQIIANVSDESVSKYSDSVARAIVAAAIFIANEFELYPPILTDAKLRDKVVEKISLALWEEELGIDFDWVLEKISKLALPPIIKGVSPLITNYVEKKRGSVTNAISFMPCDILLYQTRGEKIRDFIEAIIKDASSEPVVLIAHSLGGIACVDLLVKKHLPEVKLLITAGSQAPFLYEINALQSLEFGQPLPEHFPKWLNFYDQRDFLSYIGGNIFNLPNQPAKITDVEVVSKQPFPQSHGAYWTNSTTWNAIFQELP